MPLDAETKVLERPSDHETELRLWLRLLTCTTLIENEIRRRLRREFDVTLPRFDLMAQLDKSLDPRPPPTGPRPQLVSLTPEGRRTFRTIARAHETWIAEILADLDGSDIE